MTDRSVCDRGWLAGIVDGEGCIYARPVSAGRGAVPQFSIGMSHRVTMRRVRSLFGIRRLRERKPGGSRRTKTHYVWSVCGQQAAAALTVVLPYLYTKKKQATLLLRLADLQLGRVGTRLSPAERAKQQRLVVALKKEKY